MQGEGRKNVENVVVFFPRWVLCLREQPVCPWERISTLALTVIYCVLLLCFSILFNSQVLITFLHFLVRLWLAALEGQGLFNWFWQDFALFHQWQIHFRVGLGSWEKDSHKCYTSSLYHVVLEVSLRAVSQDWPKCLEKKVSFTWLVQNIYYN